MVTHNERAYVIYSNKTWTLTAKPVLPGQNRVCIEVEQSYPHCSKSYVFADVNDWRGRYPAYIEKQINKFLADDGELARVRSLVNA